jgi:hypothetical protein
MMSICDAGAFDSHTLLLMVVALGCTDREQKWLNR